MKYTVSKQLLADFEGSQQRILPFDSLTLEFTDDSDQLVECEASKTISVNAFDEVDYDTFEKLLTLAKAERDAKQLASDLRGVSAHRLANLTDAQVKAVIRKYKQNPDNSPNLDHFFGRVAAYTDYAGIQWCGMFLGIEKDGYTHS